MGDIKMLTIVPPMKTNSAKKMMGRIVFGAALDDAVNPVANANAREYEGDHDDNVQNSGDEQISCELVCAYKTDGLDVCGKSGLELFCDW